jgi:hypothetical protein
MTLSRLNCEPLLEFQSQSVSIFFNNKKKRVKETVFFVLGNLFLLFFSFLEEIKVRGRHDGRGGTQRVFLRV